MMSWVKKRGMRGIVSCCLKFLFLEDALAPVEMALLANDDDDIDPGEVTETGAGASRGVGASIEVQLPGGKLHYFFQDGRFQATCSNPCHKFNDTPCRLTRTSCSDNTFSCNGRPAGTLAAWLADAYHKDSRFEHRAPFYICLIPRQERLEGRELIKAQPNGPALLSQERRRREDEPEEPMQVPMGW